MEARLASGRLDRCACLDASACCCANPPTHVRLVLPALLHAPARPPAHACCYLHALAIACSTAVPCHLLHMPIAAPARPPTWTYYFLLCCTRQLAHPRAPAATFTRLLLPALLLRRITCYTHLLLSALLLRLSYRRDRLRSLRIAHIGTICACSWNTCNLKSAFCNLRLKQIKHLEHTLCNICV
jgi:hypothetical protein